MAKYLYRLQHIHEISVEDQEEINVKMLGTFTTKEQANKAIKAYKQLSGFQEKQKVFDGYDDYTEGFCVSNIVLEITYWEGGFTTVADGQEDEVEITLSLPSWFKDQQEQPDESSEGFAERMMQEKYNNTDYPRGPESEFYQIKQFKDLIKRDCYELYIHGISCRS